MNLLDPPEGNQTGSVPLTDVPGADGTFRHALDVWTGKVQTLGPQIEVALRGHQSAFYILSAVAENVQPSATFYKSKTTNDIYAAQQASQKTDDEQLLIDTSIPPQGMG